MRVLMVIAGVVCLGLGLVYLLDPYTTAGRSFGALLALSGVAFFGIAGVIGAIGRR